MKRKKKRLAVVPLEEVLRRATDVDQPSDLGAALRERRKIDPYVVPLAAPQKGGRE